MKKILLATTALVLSAGIAQAQGLTITGAGRMGVVYSRAPGYGAPAAIAAQAAVVAAAHAAIPGLRAAAAAARAALDAAMVTNTVTPALLAAVTATSAALAGGYTAVTTAETLYDALAGGSTWTEEHRLQLNFNVAVAADHGLSFGGYMRVRTNDGTAASFAGSRVWVESNGLRLTFGNQDGAIQSRLVGAQLPGYTGGTFAGSSAGAYITPQGQDSYGGGARQRVGVQYVNAGYYVHVSNDRASGAARSATEIAVGGTFGQISVMLGYADRTGAGYAAGTSMTVLAAAYNGGSWGVSAIAARRQGLGTNYMVGGNVALGGGTLNGYVGRYIDGMVATSDSTYGIGYSYGLGGGARIAAGYERTNGADRAEVGVAFNF